MSEEQNRFSLRKLSVGLASVLIGVSIFGTSQTVKADTVADQNTSAVTSNAQSSDTQENKNAVKSSFSSDNQANNVKSNLIQTQVEGKNEQKQVQTEDGQQDSVSKTQEATDSNDLQQKDAEKSIVGSSSIQQANNQSNDHADDNSQTQLDLTKDSKKLDQKALATNLTQDNSTQKDYTPNITAWTGHDDGTYYILDKYTPKNDAEKDLIVIPNEADFEKAGKSTNGHEVGIHGVTVWNFTHTYNPEELHFSETNNKKIKAINVTNDWNETFHGDTNLKAITGNSFDTSSINGMEGMFNGASSLSNISALASWDVGNVVDMSNAFAYCSSLSDLSPLEKWNTRSLQRMGHMFAYNPSLISIEPLRNWNLHNAQYQDNVFASCTNLVNIDAINNWDYSSTVIVPGYGNYPLDDMFNGDHKIKINIGTDSGLADFIRRTGRIDAFHNSSNQITTSNTKLIELLTNTDFKGQNETTTAKRTIYFDGLPSNRAIPPIVQTINYTKLATAIIDMTDTSDANAHGKIVSSGFEKDWKLDTSKQNDAVIIDGAICFKPVKIPHVNGYKAHLVRNKINPAMLMVSFVAIPSENKPSLPNEVAPSKPSANPDNTNKPADDLQQRVVTQLNSNDSGWTMPNTQPATYTVEIPADDAIIDLSDLVIAEPVHAQTRTQIRVTKRFKLSKKHSIKHLSHRKKAVKSFKKYRL